VLIPARAWDLWQGAVFFNRRERECAQKALHLFVFKLRLQMFYGMPGDAPASSIGAGRLHFAEQTGSPNGA